MIHLFHHDSNTNSWNFFHGKITSNSSVIWEKDSWLTLGALCQWCSNDWIQLLFKIAAYRFNISSIFFLTDHHVGFVFLLGPCLHHPAQELKKFYWNKCPHDQTPKDLPIPPSCWAEDWQSHYLLIYLFILLKIDLEPWSRFIKLVSVRPKVRWAMCNGDEE